jgi:1-deoxy-D-xylulose-5-phosphate synthase
VAGGAGAGVTEFLLAQGLPLATLNLGIPDEFVEHGTHEEQLRWTGLDSQGIEGRIRQALAADAASTVSTLDVRAAVELPR